MGRKSRGKKGHRGSPKRIPDEIIVDGPLRIERHGRQTLFINTSTPEEHAASMKRSLEANKEILENLKRDVATLQVLISKYDPVELMHRAAYMIVTLFVKYRSESEFQDHEVAFLPAVEYLQYLIARTEPNTDGKALSEEELDEVWEQALKIIHLTQAYLFTRKTSSDPPSEIDELRFFLDCRRLMGRVHRHPLFLIDHFTSSLTPYEAHIREIYGVEMEELLEGLKKIDEYQKTGVPDRYRDMLILSRALTDKLEAHGYAVEQDASPEDTRRIQVALEAKEFREMHEAVQEKARLALTSAIFDITNLTELPKPLLSLFSVKPGESILKTLTGSNHDDLSPLSTSVLHYKPFLEVDGKYYTFYHSGFEDHIGDIIEEDLFWKRPQLVSEMTKRRSDQLESEVENLLLSLIRPDFSYRNAFYPNPDELGDLTEIDVLLGVDDILFLVEAKAGRFSAGASRGAPRSIGEDLSGLIIKAQQQSERAERYIRSADEVLFFDKTGKEEIFRIRQAQYRKVFRVIVTRETLGWIGARIATLSILEPGLAKSYPWHVSIDDLRIIAELFKDDEVRFLHFLEVRLLASADSTLTQHDEIDHVGLYNNYNYYSKLPARGIARQTFDASHTIDIDYYLMSKLSGDSPPVPVPTQRMPPRVREFVSALRISGLPHRFEVGSMVLSMDMAWREELEKGLEYLDRGRIHGRQFAFRMPFTKFKHGVTVSCADDTHWADELRRSAVQMEQGSCDRWLVVQIANVSLCKIRCIELLVPDKVTSMDLTAERVSHEMVTRKRIATQKPSRNDLCPCGSGKKFKRCHGSRTT